MCREIIDKVDTEAKKLLADVIAKMVEWERKLVALGNAKDKARALQVCVSYQTLQYTAIHCNTLQHLCRPW